ncbi:ComEA family DNA-binding protein [Aliarcobacter butzleri]|uniref:Helix-hairpin-helix domain-containing protein n=2 Tax=Aliarcobacter butzleri TaxID=28197 RepID=A0AAW7PZR1_9BACT|nr:helix-hairpin-helix domain-containing protein [Aliarcobacter butzleri]KLD98884.1 competence protein ComEA [Aliarcobacter butzleri L348]MDN5071333.1 helix-hairpin-helix domain-containing protein [Aliarcobacter butzleri]
MKKIVALFALCGTLVFGVINLQTASKEELMSIKGIGEKKAEQIMEYRKTNTIKSADDLKNIKGFGDNIVTNIKENNMDTVKEQAKNEVNDKVDERKKDTQKKLDEKSEQLSNKLNEKASSFFK